MFRVDARRVYGVQYEPGECRITQALAGKIGANSTLRVPGIGDLFQRILDAPSAGMLTGSTQPVRMAALGIPSYCAVSGSCTMTMPPAALTALAPVEPSCPVPDRITATQRSSHAEAAESRSRTPDGMRADHRIGVLEADDARLHHGVAARGYNRRWFQPAARRLTSLLPPCIRCTPRATRATSHGTWARHVASRSSTRRQVDPVRCTSTSGRPNRRPMPLPRLRRGHCLSFRAGPSSRRWVAWPQAVHVTGADLSGHYSPHRRKIATAAGYTPSCAYGGGGGGRRTGFGTLPACSRACASPALHGDWEKLPGGVGGGLFVLRRMCLVVMSL